MTSFRQKWLFGNPRFDHGLPCDWHSGKAGATTATRSRADPERLLLRIAQKGLVTATLLQHEDQNLIDHNCKISIGRKHGIMATVVVTALYKQYIIMTNKYYNLQVSDLDSKESEWVSYELEVISVIMVLLGIHIPRHDIVAMTCNELTAKYNVSCHIISFYKWLYH